MSDTTKVFRCVKKHQNRPIKFHEVGTTIQVGHKYVQKKGKSKEVSILPKMKYLGINHMQPTG